MKPWRSAMLVMGFGIACLHADLSHAQVETTTESLAKSAGFWKSTSPAPNGEEQLSYEWHVYVDELDMVVHWSVRVSPESKEVVETGLGYFGVRGNPGQVQGLFFSSTGLAAEVVGTLTDTGMFGHGHGVLPGGRSIAADLRWTLDGDRKFTSTFFHTVGPEGYSEQGYSQSLEKLDYSSFRDFVDGEGIAFNTDAEPLAELAPLVRLVGQWEVNDDEGVNQLTVNYRFRAQRRWLFERWRFAGGQTGLNISGIDPASGRLALWSITPNYIGRSGRWDVLADNTLGQVQGTARLIREFTDADTFAAHWQDLQDGAFVDRDAEGYIAKRVSRERQQADQQANAARAAWLELPEATEEAYAQLEGTWERPLKIGDEEGRAVKSHNAGKTTVSYYNSGGELIRQHTSEYKLKVEGGVHVFVHFNHQTTKGPARVRANDLARYICRVHRGKFYEIYGVLKEQRGVPRMLIWDKSGLAVSAAPATRTSSAREDTSATAARPLIGAWKRVSSRRNSEAEWNPFNPDITMVKYITGTHWTWIVRNSETNEVGAVAGGKASVDGDEYKELIEFGRGRILQGLGTQTRFTWKVDGDRLYKTYRGGDGDGRQEQWERLDTSQPVSHPLVGSWRRISLRPGANAWRDQNPNVVMLKNITGGHWNWITFDAETREVIAAAGGEAKIDGDSYSEIVRFGAESLQDQEQAFKWNLENGRFHQAGTLSNGNELEEKFLRVASAMERMNRASTREERTAPTATALGKIYATVGFMRVPKGGDALYRQVESVWKKRHQARKDAGLIRDWALLKVERRSQEAGPYQYVTFTVGDSFRQLRSNDGFTVEFSPEEREIMGKTAQARTMLGVDVWELEISALPSRRPQDAAPNFTIGFMKSKDENAHFELERDVYSKVWQERAKAGLIWNWSIWRRRSGQGLYAEAPPYNMVSVVSHPTDRSSVPQRGQVQAARAAFPEDTPEQLRRRLGRANEVRDMYGYETWTVVDHTVGSEAENAEAERTEDEETSASTWQDEEWSKLVGVWRAPLENGAYRIKRITEGEEILEVYSRDDELQWKTKVDMAIERHEDLNFFTVKNRVQLHPPGEEPPSQDNGQYSSIYKVHDGKWYEQLRGIFADNENLAPNAFLIYSKVEE